jgi:hypothetical protein
MCFGITDSFNIGIPEWLYLLAACLPVVRELGSLKSFEVFALCCMIILVLSIAVTAVLWNFFCVIIKESSAYNVDNPKDLAELAQALKSSEFDTDSHSSSGRRLKAAEGLRHRVHSVGSTMALDHLTRAASANKESGSFDIGGSGSGPSSQMGIRKAKAHRLPSNESSKTAKRKYHYFDHLDSEKNAHGPCIMLASRLRKTQIHIRPDEVRLQ